MIGILSVFKFAEHIMNTVNYTKSIQHRCVLLFVRCLQCIFRSEGSLWGLMIRSTLLTSRRLHPYIITTMPLHTLDIELTNRTCIAVFVYKCANARGYIVQSISCKTFDKYLRQIKWARITYIGVWSIDLYTL